MIYDQYLAEIQKRQKKATEPQEEVVHSYKGFDQTLSCRGFQFEIGKTYSHDGPVEICASGFHACEYPLDVFHYYSPANNRFAEVEQTGFLARHSDDSKVASAKITVTAEINFSTLIERAVKWVFDRAKPEGEGSHATGERGAASATGVSGTASATGWSGAASATGESGAASATGERGAASATGERGAATASGLNGRAQGAEGCALFLVYRDDDWKIVHVWAGIVGQNGVKPLTWYRLDETGKPCEVT